MIFSDPTEMTFFYTSYHPGIADLNALDIPTDCQHPSDSVGLVLSVYHTLRQAGGLTARLTASKAAVTSILVPRESGV